MLDLNESHIHPEIKDDWLRRILNRLPTHAQYLVFHAPDGSGAEIVASAWLASKPSVSDQSTFQKNANLLASATGARLQIHGGVNQSTGFSLFFDGVSFESSLVIEFITSNPEIPMTLHFPDGKNDLEPLLIEPKTTFLLPEILFYTKIEVESVLPPINEQDDPWQQTAGWPPAVHLLMNRRQEKLLSEVVPLRAMAVSLLKWIQESKVEDLFQQVSLLPHFTRRVTENLTDGEFSPGPPEKTLQTLGLALTLPQDSAHQKNPQRFEVPQIMREAIRIYLFASGNELAKHWQFRALHALAESGSCNLAVRWAMDYADWNVAKKILNIYWGMGITQTPHEFTRTVKYFLAHCPKAVLRRTPSKVAIEEIAQSMSPGLKPGSNSSRMTPVYTHFSKNSKAQHSKSSTTVTAREPLLDVLLRMVTLRLQGKWQDSWRLAHAVSQRLLTEQERPAPSVAAQSMLAVSWHQVALTQHLSCDLRSAKFSYIKAKRISRANNLYDFEELISGDLILLHNSQGHLYPTSIREDPEKTISSDGVAIRDIFGGESQVLSAAFAAIWRLDEQAFLELMGRLPEGEEHTEFWLYKFLLNTLYEVLFGDRVLALNLVQEKNIQFDNDSPSLLGKTLSWATGLALLFNGRYAKVIELTDQKPKDPSGMMPLLRCIAYAAQGNVDTAIRETFLQLDSRHTAIGPHALLEVLMAHLQSIRASELLSANLSYLVRDDNSLVVTLPLWIIGVPVEEIQKAFSLSETDLSVLHKIRRVQPRLNPIHSQLTEREIVILRSMAQSKSRKAMAAELHVSTNTIKTHVASCYKKLGVTNQEDAISEAIIRGYL